MDKKSKDRAEGRELNKFADGHRPERINKKDYYELKKQVGEYWMTMMQGEDQNMKGERLPIKEEAYCRYIL